MSRSGTQRGASVDCGLLLIRSSTSYLFFRPLRSNLLRHSPSQVEVKPITGRYNDSGSFEGCARVEAITIDKNGLITLYSDIQTEPVRWLWYPYIAIGKITLLQGDPGDGKSTMMMHIIAELSKGGISPDGKEFGIPRRVIYQCSEDGVADTIKPRLEKCGAICENVAFLNEEVHEGLTLDDERLRQAITEFKPCLVVIDPVQAYLGNDSDLIMAARARKLMHRIGMWATVFDCAVVLIGHLNKREGGKELYRGLGSIDVVAAARSVMQVDRSDEDADIASTQSMSYKDVMKGIYTTCVNKGTLDISPFAYKPMDEIVVNIKPTAEIVSRIKPIYNFKAGDED